jgi:excisionase family DNA binding protein
MTDPLDIQLLNVKEAARALRVSQSLVYKMASEGRIPCVKIPCPGQGKRTKTMVRFKHSDLVDFIEAHYAKA